MPAPERCLPNTILKSSSATWEPSTGIWTSSYIAVRNDLRGRTSSRASRSGVVAPTPLVGRLAALALAVAARVEGRVGGDEVNGR